jgi:hypothetical protein
VFGFFNNHFAGHSPESVRQFAELLGVDLRMRWGTVREDGQMELGLDAGSE